VPSSTMLKCVVRLKLCGRHRQTVPSDDDVQHGCDYGSGLGVIVVVVHGRLCCTTSSFVD